MAQDGEERITREESAPIAVAAMKQILMRYPPKDLKTVRVPWQPNPGFAAYYASFDDRRVVIVPMVEGKADSQTAQSLESPEVLKKHFTNYVFLKLAPNNAPPEIQKAMEKAGPEGLVILERPESTGSLKKTPLNGAKVLAAAAGPHSPASIKKLLDKYERPPGWEQQISVSE